MEKTKQDLLFEDLIEDLIKLYYDSALISKWSLVADLDDFIANLRNELLPEDNDNG